MMKERSKDDDRGLTIVRERYSNLNQLIGDLSLKLSEVSSSIDNEFLSAYRVHMVDVQEDLKSLKQQVATAESALHDDSAVSTLETEVNWFSDETSRLRSHAMSMRKDMHHILARIDALNEQRHFLNDQLKQVLKRSKVLEAEIDGNMNNTERSVNNATRPGLDSTSEGFDIVRTSSEQGGPATFSDGRRHSENRRDSDNRDRNRDNRNNDAEGNEYNDSNDNNDNDQYYSMAQSQSIPHINKKSLSFKSMRLRKVQSAPQGICPPKAIIRDALISSKTTTKQAESNGRKDPGYQLDLLLSLKSPEETILEREIEVIYREILMRKKDDKARNTASGLSARSARKVLEAETDNDIQQQCRRKGGVTGLGLDLFSDEDRMCAVMNFLQDPVAFEKVVQVLAVNYVDIGLDQT